MPESWLRQLIFIDMTTRKRKEVEVDDTEKSTASPVTTEQVNQQERTDQDISGQDGIVIPDKENVDSVTPKPITVVIPYCSSEAQGHELLFALRSWDKNFRELHNIVVIGDSESWFDDEMLTFIPLERVSDNPQVNVMEALKVAIESDVVSDRFIWTNDDIYLIAPIGLDYISIPKITGTLLPDKHNGHYRENMKRTIEFLRRSDFPIFNYGTHTPVIFDKEKIVSLLEEFPEIGVGDCLFSSIYFNAYAVEKPLLLDWKTDGILLPVISQSPDPEMFMRLFNNKVFMNNATSGYSQFLEDVLRKLFPEESLYEK